ncbi:hypothetical protein DPMN_166779 [Dreissena polymorpha]|uniref:Uncharacterized protein n=1 Tax=Dreissena polymorpha TaxID=45954 RepID=A0A9D4IXX4_DREPO|nr:hypothetical protein DPMN_166779 [Dreissena polymorpha]
MVVLCDLGSVLKLESVDAIVCAVDGNMKGNLVKNLETAGGKPYQIALKKERY